MAANCPACRIEMSNVQFLGTYVDVCPNCAGIWFDEGELLALAREGQQTLETLDRSFQPSREILDLPDKAKRCPRCNLVLQSQNYLYSSPVKIDVCPNCNGVFVEDKELTQIQQWLKKSSEIEPTGTMKARQRLKGGRKQKPKDWNENANVESLVQALQQRRDDSSKP